MLGDNPGIYWRLGESSGGAVDSAGGVAGTVGAGVTRGAAGAVVADPDTAATFNGTSTGRVVTPAAVAGPQQLSVEAWFRTTSTRGGKIIGFGNSATGNSTSHDRHVYLRNNGQLTFGVYPGAARTVTSPQSYNNGQWHHVVASLSPTAGMSLYVDGTKVASDPAVTSTNPYNGYWRVGGDTVTSWPGAPTSGYLSGTIDEVAIYNSPLSDVQVTQHYADSGNGASVPNTPPVAAFTADTNTPLQATFDAGQSSDPDGSLTGYRWDFGDGTSDIGTTPTHRYAAAGTYQVRLTVTDDDGGTNTLTKDVTVASNAPTVRDTFARSVTTGWGTADVGGAWTASGAGANFAVANGVGTVATAVGQTKHAFLGEVSQNSAETQLVTSLDKAATGGGNYVTVLGRRIDAQNDYRAKVRVLSTGAVSAFLARNVAATETTLATTTVAGLTYAPGDRLQVRVQVDGTSPTTLRMKVWKDGTAEPANWLLTTSDPTAALQAKGSVGLMTYVSASATNAPITASFDNLWVGLPRP